MKTIFASFVLFVALPFSQASASSPPTTINATNLYAYSANTGWIDWRGDVTRGAVIGDYVCEGFIYSANLGWINLGSGSPTNGIRYQNVSASDFGVNHDGLGNLRGFAWSANAGWISFEPVGVPTVNLETGNLTGYAYGANVGWISLSNASAHVTTDSFFEGADVAGNGLPDPWEMEQFGLLGIDRLGDPDLDGRSNEQECLAATDPNDGTDSLRITLYTRDATQYNMLGWTAKPTRLYTVQRTTQLSDLGLLWIDCYSHPSLGGNLLAFEDLSTNAFYSVRPHRPLTP